MRSLSLTIYTPNAPIKISSFHTKNINTTTTPSTQTLFLQGHTFFRTNGQLTCLSTSKPQSFSNPQFDRLEEEEEEEEYVQNLRVPNNWLNPSKALEESEWLRITLHKWLDDEYCPEATNVEISKVAALSYYESLMAKETDLGEILLKMAVKLERISFQESFHGAFSSANAAVNLILQRIVQD